ncbi:MAG TPA: beta-ketoacyl synthase N-terminal-like domain-containing protein [Candidatus Polarisedimenticolia bacterium]|nr:beta-ketoacyl synthase N-terminal-like domain-containing protein [Candidatus Polarisedimenticolia bacterium]
MRFVRFEPAPIIAGWGALTPWGRGVSAWSEAAPRHVGAGDEIERLASLPDLLARRLDRFGLLALAASREAFASSTFAASGAPDGGCGVLFGSRHGCASSNRAYGEDLARLPVRELRPALFVRTVSGAAAADVSMALGLRGPSQTFVSGPLAGAEALAGAATALVRGTAPLCLTGGIEVPPGDGDATRLEAAAAILLERGDRSAGETPLRLRLVGAAFGRDVEGSGTLHLLADAVEAGCDLVAIANPAPPEVLPLWRQAAGRARVLFLGAHGDLGAAGAVLAAGLSDAGCDRGAVVVARDPSGETALLRFER